MPFDCKFVLPLCSTVPWAFFFKLFTDFIFACALHVAYVIFYLLICLLIGEFIRWLACLLAELTDRLTIRSKIELANSIIFE